MTERNDFGDLLEPGFREIYDDAFKEIPLVFPRIFQVEDSTKQDEKESGITGFGLLEQTGENDSVRYEDPLQMYDVTYTHLKYTKGFKITEEMWEDDQYGRMKTKPAALARAARRTSENSAANVFNRGFNTSYVGGDAKPLFSVSHPRVDGGSSQSNASSTGLTLTDTNLETARIAARGQLDDKGMKIQVMPKQILVSPSLEKTAETIVGSEQKAGTADNDMNMYRGKFEVIAWDYLTSTTAWHLLDKTQHLLKFFWRVRPQFKQDTAFDTGAALFKTRTRFSNGFSDWRGTWGSKGDGAAYAS